MMKQFAIASLVVAALAAPAARADTAGFDKQMQPILEQYLKIQVALAADKTDGVKVAADRIGKLSSKLKPGSVSGDHTGHYKDIPKKLKVAATAVAGAGDIKATREAFKGMSKPMAMWATMSKPAGAKVAFCSMAKGSWLQAGDEIRNPYYGSEMLTCGEFVGGAPAADEKQGGHGMHGGH